MTQANDPAMVAPGGVEGYEETKPGGWEDYPLDELAIREERRAAVDVVRRLAAGRFKLDPDFQRDFGVLPQPCGPPCGHCGLADGRSAMSRSRAP